MCISQGGSTAHDAHADSTEEVRQANCEASPKHGVTCMVISMANSLGVSSTEGLSHVANDNCHDDAVDGHSLTEDDTDQVLGWQRVRHD